jgi:hypothetical protein
MPNHYHCAVNLSLESETGGKAYHLFPPGMCEIAKSVQETAPRTFPERKNPESDHKSA